MANAATYQLGWHLMTVTHAEVRPSHHRPGQQILQLTLNSIATGLQSWWYGPLTQEDYSHPTTFRTMNEALKRRTFEPLGLEWPQRQIPLDLKIFTGREVWACRSSVQNIQGYTAVRVSDLSRSMPLAAALMATSRPGNYHLRHFRVSMHEKHVYLPNGKPGVLTACNDLVSVSRTKEYTNGQLKRPLPSCSGCMMFHDAWIENDFNWEGRESEALSTDREEWKEHVASLPRQLKSLTYANHAAFLRHIKIPYFMPLKEY